MTIVGWHRRRRSTVSDLRLIPKMARGGLGALRQPTRRRDCTWRRSIRCLSLSRPRAHPGIGHDRAAPVPLTPPGRAEAQQAARTPAGLPE